MYNLIKWGLAQEVIEREIERRKKKEYKIKLKCGCVYNVFAEDKGHAECQVDYLHYIDTERDKIKICKKRGKNETI